MTDEQFAQFLLERKMKQERKKAKKTVATLIIAVMITADVLLGFRSIGHREAANKITVQTETPDWEAKAEELKDTAYKELCLVPIFGICIAGLSAALMCWTDT